jgi:WD40 repeat protein/serine/threonine protein kinase
MDYVTDSEIPAVWRVGDVMLGLYEVKRVFTSGGMGLVYRIGHRGWNMDLAVKSPRQEYLRSPAQKEHFVRECETWIGLGLHPHIVSCHYVRTLGGIPRVFAEYVDGGSLREWIDSGRLYSGGPDEALRRVLNIAIQMAWGLSYAHERGVVHQDVKPGNVLVAVDENAKVTDFGLARARTVAGESPTDGAAPTNVLASCGGMTPAYCSPEQAHGAPLSSKTDIWSWAISVFEMFVGEPPCRHGGQLAGEIFAAYRASKEDGDGLLPLPPGIAALLAECFQRDPAKRPSDLKGIAERIAAVYGEMFNLVYPHAQPKAVELLADELNNRALSLRDLGSQAESARLMREALKANPGHLPAVFNSGILAWRSGTITDLGLLTEVRTVRKTDPTDWSAAYAEGLVHLERSDVASGIAQLEESVRLGGDEAARKALEAAAALSANAVRSLGALEGKTDIVTPPVFTPDERSLLSGVAGKALGLWDVEARRCLRTFDGADDDVKAIAVCADGRLAVSGSQDGTLRLWDVYTGRCLRTFETAKHVPHGVSLSPDGTYAASAGSCGDGPDDFSVHLWDTTTGRHVSALNGHTGPILTVRFSPDGRWLLSGGYDATVRVWNTASRRCERILEGHSMHVASVAISADSRFAVSGAMDSTMRVWEVATGRCLGVLAHSDYVYSVSLSGDAQWAISACWGGGMCLWHLPRGRCIRTFGLENPRLSGVVSAVLGPGRRYAASKHLDGTLHLWSIAALCRDSKTYEYAPLLVARPRTTKDLVSKQNRFSVLLDQARDALTAEHYSDALRLVEEARAVRGFELARGALDLRAQVGLRCARNGFRRGWCLRTFRGHRGTVGAVWLTADGRRIFSGDNSATIIVWDVATGEAVKNLVGHDRTVTCFAGDLEATKWVVSGSYDGTLRLWEPDSGKCVRRYEGHESYVYATCVSRDGRWMVSGSDDKTARLWELATGRCLRVFAGHTGGIRSVALSPDGQWLATGSYDNKIIWDDETQRSGRLPGAKEKMLRLWHFPTGKCVWVLEGHTSGVQSVAFSGDGRRLVSWSDDGTLRVWDVETGRCVQTVDAGKEGVLSTDGRWVVSHGKGHSLHLWDLTSGKCECSLEGHTDTVISSFVSASGRWLVSGSMDRTIRLWELDWDFAARGPADWDDEAQRFLANFIVVQRPYAGELPRTRRPEEGEVAHALARSGKPSWTTHDFERLLGTLAAAGYGWLRREVVLRELEKMAAACQGST